MRKLIRVPSAWIPLVMSASALALVLGYLLITGIPQVPEEDEGTAAHLFQLLMGGQIPIIAYFAFRWLPKKPKETIQILALQFLAGVIAFTPVYLLEM